MPPVKGFPAHQEAVPSVPGEHPGGRGEEGPISGGEAGSGPSSTEDLQLVAEDRRLEVPLINSEADEQAEQPALEAVSEGPEHLGKSDGSSTNRANEEVRPPIEFLYPTGFASGPGSMQRCRVHPHHSR
jgi:hypothetical protein